MLYTYTHICIDIYVCLCIFVSVLNVTKLVNTNWLHDSGNIKYPLNCVYKIYIRVIFGMWSACNKFNYKTSYAKKGWNFK